MNRVLITGGASGLGAALAARFSARGDRVLVTDVNEPATLPAGARFQRLDITSESDWAAAADRVRDEFGGLDILVNNAGIAAGGRIDRLGADHWQRVLSVNVLGAVHGCRTFAPLFKQQGSGHLVNVASAAGLLHPPAMLLPCQHSPRLICPVPRRPRRDLVSLRLGARKLTRSAVGGGAGGGAVRRATVEALSARTHCGGFAGLLPRPCEIL